MTTDIRIKADEARRLKTDSAFSAFVQEVRDDQIKRHSQTAARQTLPPVKRRTRYCVR
jgi:hypothetical protein